MSDAGQLDSSPQWLGQVKTSVAAKRLYPASSLAVFFEDYKDLLAELNRFKTDNQLLADSLNSLRAGLLSNPGLPPNNSTAHNASAASVDQHHVDLSAFVSTLERQLSTSSSENTTLRENVKQLQKKHQDMSSQFKRHIETAKESTSQYNNLRSQYQTAIHKHREMLQALKERDVAIQLLRDEAQTRELELNTTEDKLAKLQKENRHLVDRWMKKMEEEAEKMNEANHFIQSVAVMKEKSAGQTADATVVPVIITPPQGPVHRTSTSTLPTSPSRKESTDLESPVGLGFIKSRFSTLLNSGSTIRRVASMSNVPQVVPGSPSPIQQQQQQNEEVQESRQPLWIDIRKATLPQNLVKQIEAHDSEAVCMATSIDGRFIATGGGDDKLKLWHTNGTLVQSVSGSLSTLTCLAFDASATSLASGTADYIIRLYKIIADDALQTTHTLTGHIGKITAAVYTGRGDRLITGSVDRTIKVWDLNKSYCTKTIFAVSSVLDTLLLDWNGNTLATAHQSKCVRIWDGITGIMAKEMADMFHSAVTSIRILERDTLAACTRDNDIKLIDLRSAKEVGTLYADKFRVGSNTHSIGVSTDFQYVVAGSVDGSIHIWDVRERRWLTSLQGGHKTNVCSVAWDAKGASRMYSLEKEKMLSFWE